MAVPASDWLRHFRLLWNRWTEFNVLYQVCVGGDVEILLPVTFRWILFNSCKDVKNVLAKRRLKHKLCRGRVEILLPMKFRRILFNGCRWSKMRRQIKGHRGHIMFSVWLTWSRTLIFCFLSSFVEFRSAVSEKSKMCKWRQADERTTRDHKMHLSLRRSPPPPPSRARSCKLAILWQKKIVHFHVSSPSGGTELSCKMKEGFTSRLLNEVNCDYCYKKVRKRSFPFLTAQRS